MAISDPVRICQRGGMGAAALDIGALYRTHGPWLRDWLRRRTRCTDRAEDLAQDTFHRLLEKGGELALRDARNFLVVVARRLLIDEARRQSLERDYLRAAAMFQDGCNELTPERICGAIRELDSLLDLLSHLPADVRTAFLLRRIDGLNHGEIAERLGISDRTVKRHISKAYVLCCSFTYPD